MDSHEHHFLPIFYLEGFTNDENKFYIYLKDQNRFKKNKKLFSPASHFWIRDDNTMNFEGKQSDHIEELYSITDSQIAVLFKKFQSNPSAIPPLTDNEFVFLEYFIGKLYWRLPFQIPKLKALAENRKLKTLGIIFRDKTNNEVVEDAELEEKIKKSGNLPLMLKSMYPGLFYPLLFDRISKMRIFNFPTNLPNLIGDNPIIMKKENSFTFYKDDFIFPLTPNKILVRSDNIVERVVANVKVEIDMYILMQSSYTACTDLNYPRMLREVFLNEYQTLEFLRDCIFKKLLPNN